MKIRFAAKTQLYWIARLEPSEAFDIVIEAGVIWTLAWGDLNESHQE